MENIEPDKVFGIKINSGEQIQISSSSGDHAVRYPEKMGYLDHLVIFSPVPVTTEDGEPAELYYAERYFIGSVAVEAIVRVTGIGEVYYDAVTESVYEHYQEQELAKLDSELGDLEE